MAWHDPITWVFKTTILSATLLNQQIRDNLNYLKSKPKAVAVLSGSDQTGITTAWVKVTGSDLQIDVDDTVDLNFIIRLHVRSTTGEARVGIDIWDADNNVYLSSGTLTPKTWGFGITSIATANIGHSIAFNIIVPNISDGIHNYEIRIISSHAATTIDHTNSKNQIAVREI